MSSWRIAAGTFFLLGVGSLGWTQYLAYQYGYHEALGHSLWTFQAFYRRHHVYVPWKAIEWQWRWGGIWWQVGLVGGSVLLMGLVLLTVWLRKRYRRLHPPEMTGHGTTQWATTADVRRAGLL